MFRCELVRSPQNGRAVAANTDALITVKGRGAILGLSSGQLLEVDQIDVIYTALWLPGADLLILDGSRVLNLTTGDQPVSVRPAR